VTDASGRSLTLGEYDPDLGTHTYMDMNGKPFIPAPVLQAARARIRELQSKAENPGDEYRNRIRSELAQEYEARIVEAQLDAALTLHGFAEDEETRQEVMARYSAVKADAEGKRPSLRTWLQTQREANEGAGARWTRSYLKDPERVTATPPAGDSPPTPTSPPRPRSDPNGGAGRGLPPATGGKLSDRDWENMSFAEVSRNLASLRASEGLPPRPAK
jgi:hypothetical protein